MLLVKFKSKQYLCIIANYVLSILGIKHRTTEYTILALRYGFARGKVCRLIFMVTVAHLFGP